MRDISSHINKLSLYFKADDLIQHFSNLEAAGTLPSFTVLELAARELHRAYSSTRALHHAMRDVEKPSVWSHTVPRGTAWRSPLACIANDINASSAEAASHCSDTTFKGDLILARSIAFMRDALVSREAAYAAAEGDVGRLYEMIKVCQWSYSMNMGYKIDCSGSTLAHAVHICWILTLKICHIPA